MRQQSEATAACGMRREVPADGEIAPSTGRLAKADVSLQDEPYREKAAGEPYARGPYATNQPTQRERGHPAELELLVPDLAPATAGEREGGKISETSRAPAAP